MKVRKAVITAAGFGTRMLPATKAMPKEMLPILNKPIIQYVVEELVQSGIKEIIIVTSWQKRAIEDHFDHSPELEHHLEKKSKKKELNQIKKIANMANFVYLRQKGPLGNGTPALNAQPLIEKEPFIYAFADDLVISKTPFSKQLIEKYRKNNCSVLGVQEVKKSETGKYGIVELDNTKTMRVTNIIEKLTPTSAPSNLALFGRYLLTPQIFPILKKTPLGKGKELWIADALRRLAQKERVIAQKIKGGRWYTTGDPINLLAATAAYLKRESKIWKKTKKYFVST